MKKKMKNEKWKCWNIFKHLIFIFKIWISKDHMDPKHNHYGQSWVQSMMKIFRRGKISREERGRRRGILIIMLYHAIMYIVCDVISWIFPTSIQNKYFISWQIHREGQNHRDPQTKTSLSDGLCHQKKNEKWKMKNEKK